MGQGSRSCNKILITLEVFILDKLSQIGGVLLLVGIMSFLLSLVGLELKSMSFLGEYKRIVEIVFVVIGLIVLFVASKLKKKDEE